MDDVVQVEKIDGRRTLRRSFDIPKPAKDVVAVIDREGFLWIKTPKGWVLHRPVQPLQVRRSWTDLFIECYPLIEPPVVPGGWQAFAEDPSVKWPLRDWKS